MDRIHLRIGPIIAVIAFALACAQAQASEKIIVAQSGSTGGAIGKQGKSAAGGDDNASAPRRPAAAPDLCAKLIGTWSWALGTSTTFSSGGTGRNSSGMTSTWTCKDGTASTVWSTGTNNMIIAPDGKSMSVTGPFGSGFTSTRQ